MTTPIPSREERRELPLSEEELAGLEHHNGGDANIAALIAQAREALSLKAELAEVQRENERMVALASSALVDLMPIERHEHEYQRRCPVCRYVWPANAGFRGQKHDLACPVGMAVDAVDEASDNVNRSPPNE